MLERIWRATFFLMVALAAVAGAARAQEQVLIRGGATSTEITVIAPRLIRREVGRTASGSANEQVSLTRHVSYADLDLSRPADVQKLEKRVNDMAKVACDQLAALYPFAAPNTPDCVRQALSGAMQQVRTAVDAAGATH
jgi:UrcA family protein